MTTAITPIPADPRLLPSPPRVRFYGWIVGFVAALTGTLLVIAGPDPGPPLVIAALAAVAALAERRTVRLSATIEESISALPMLFAAVLFGPLAGFAVGAASMLGDFTRPYLRWGIYTSSRALTGTVVGALAMLTPNLIENRALALAGATLLAAVIAQVLDAAFAAFTVHLRRTGDANETFRLLLPVGAAAVPLYAPLVALLVVAYDQVSPWATLLFFVPALAAQRLYSLYQDQRLLAEGLAAANDRLEQANVSFAAALVATLDARDQYTAGHSAAVAIYSRDIAAQMGLGELEQQRVHLCGLVHDIGKVGLAPGLLEKPGPLTLDERRQMQEHAAIGERILLNVEGYADIARVVRHHHERVDGNGYPDGLREGQIPRLSEIIAVADAYNAMTSDRPYRDGMPSRVARLRLAQAAGSQFSISVVAAFEAVLATSDEAYRNAAGDEFVFSRPELPDQSDGRLSGAA